MVQNRQAATRYSYPQGCDDNFTVAGGIMSQTLRWTDERIEQLKTLWQQGHSASQIALMMGDGITRNAVIGKVHRLKLSGDRPTTFRRNHTVRVVKQRKMVRRYNPAKPDLRPIIVPGLQGRKVGKGLGGMPMDYVDGDLSMAVPHNQPLQKKTGPVRDCCFPMGDPRKRDFKFCCEKTLPGMPYCELHARIAFQPANKKKDDEKRLAALY